MTFDFYVTKSPAAPAMAALRTVYRVYADKSYDVRKKGVPYGDVVALRTTGGEGRVTIDGCDEIAVTPGTLLFFEHARVRRYHCAGESWDFWWFEFAAGEPAGLPLNRLLDIETAGNEPEDCEACLELLKKAAAGTDRLASASFSLLLGKWMLSMEGRGPESPHRAAMENAVAYMKRNVDKPVTIKELARMAGLCERRFRQVFAETTGMQPKKYHEAMRIALAEELLLNTPLPVGEISQRLGYSSQFHFCQAFRAARSMPPSRFRSEGGLRLRV